MTMTKKSYKLYIKGMYGRVWLQYIQQKKKRLKRYKMKHNTQKKMT